MTGTDIQTADTAITVTFTTEQAEIVTKALGRISRADGDSDDDLLAAFYAYRAVWEARQ